MVSVVGRAGAAAALRSFERRKPNFLRRRLFASVPRCSSLQPPDIPLLADAARISLSAKEVEDFAPKIRQVIDWFGQLQAVDLESVQPSFRADTELNSYLREDSPETFQNREAILAEVPTYDSPYIKGRSQLTYTVRFEPALAGGSRSSHPPGRRTIRTQSVLH